MDKKAQIGAGIIAVGGAVLILGVIGSKYFLGKTIGYIVAAIGMMIALFGVFLERMM